MMLSSWTCSACTVSGIDGSQNCCPLCYTPCSALPSGSSLFPLVASTARTLHRRNENVDGKRDPAENVFHALSKRQRIGEFASTVVPTVGMDMRVRWDEVESLDAWLEASRPSKISKFQCAWIQVSNANERSPGFKRNEHTLSFNHAAYMPALNELKTIIENGGRISAATKKACVELLLDIAKQQGFTTGKWMIFVPPGWADFVWEKIARATAAGHLGCSAKIAPTQGLQEHEMALCCIYVRDFSSRPEVQRVLLQLEAMDLKIKCGFKPDIFTELGIESKNDWRLPPTIYSRDEVKRWFSGVP
jgi:hypothetical protein